MKLVTRPELARLAGVSKQAVSRAIKDGKVTIIGSGRTAKVDITADNAATYISKGKEERPAGVTQKNKKRKHPENNQNPSNSPVPMIEPSGEDITADINSLSGPTLNRLKIIEGIKQTQTKTAKERGELVDRNLVRRVLAQIYTVDTNEWRTLSQNLAPELAATFDNHDPKKMIAVEKLIDREIFAILQHSKRIINDFLKTIDVEEIGADISVLPSGD